MSTKSPERVWAPTLDDLVGPAPEGLRVSRREVEIREGVRVTTWRYDPPPLEGVPSRPPVVALHGGPAFTHNYIVPLKLLAHTPGGFPVIFYDQAGCGASSRFEDAATEMPCLLTLAYYLEELEAVVAALELEEYYLYGSSWGTVLAQEAAVLQPKGLLGLILDGAFANGQHYITTQWRDRIATLPTFTQRLLRELEDAKDYDSPTYAALETVLTTHFTTRLVPKPQCWFDCLAGQDVKIYIAMQGHSEFTLAGVLGRWCIRDRLHRVQVPALVLAGEFDTMSQETHMEVVDGIPHSWPLVTVPRAAHCKLIDEPQLCCAHIEKFLNTVESIRQRG